MGRVEDRHAGRFIYPAALHAHEAILDHVDLADAVAAADLVQQRDHLVGAEPLAVNADRRSGLETDPHVFRFVRCLLRCDAHAELDQLETVFRRVFQLARLGADVQAVLVDAVRLGRRDAYRDFLGPAVFDHLATAGKFLAEPLDPPGGDDPHVRIERLGRELEATLVVPLARGAVGEGVGPDLAGNLQTDLRDQRSGDRRAQQIHALVLRVPLQDGKGEVAAQLFPHVYDPRRGGPNVAGFLHDRLAVLTGLAEIDVHAMHVVSFVHQPAENDRGVQSAGIGKNAVWHGRIPCCWMYLCSVC